MLNKNISIFYSYVELESFQRDHHFIVMGKKNLYRNVACCGPLDFWMIVDDFWYDATHLIICPTTWMLLLL
jgi:hypothetical protein